MCVSIMGGSELYRHLGVYEWKCVAFNLDTYSEGVSIITAHHTVLYSTVVYDIVECSVHRRAPPLGAQLSFLSS